jgi:hypothetical protein
MRLSAVYNARAAQMKEKLRIRARENGSWYTQMPSVNCTDGARYCSKPRV